MNLIIAEMVEHLDQEQDNKYSEMIAKFGKETIEAISELEQQQIELNNLTIQNEMVMINEFRESHQRFQAFKPSREKIPHYWSYVLQNSGILKKIQSTNTDIEILEHLKDIYLTSFTVVSTVGPVIADRKRLRIGFKLVFEFEKNEWFEETELSKTVSYIFNEPIYYPKISNSGVTFYDGKNPKMIDSSQHSFFDFFEPINQKEEYSNEEEEEEIEDKLDEQLDDTICFSNDIILNSLYYFKNQMEPYSDDDEDDFSSEFSSLLNEDSESSNDESYESE
ncbi:nucleosome assembly protein, putative [Entamoeba histolytica HM-1:IMSS-B]|uniref:Nucleosome assembly protein, putative n=6 Tax=Entamoeba histolytica TaxID=5759 RepID=C4M4B8_ENTH1|nr:nucleosome assembly protein, putative [Entamoeba histolytica HM-1:IMSS]EMD43219.1 nucleosome assembly protein (NAP) protein, putative [Entamoeba histolytica KU27]EMH77814.1 nucleosome assembly protein, putative [Entamoeba histolytica HM-1:IMSS-B]EMS13983.1 nucleosome assembly protein (nap) protein [Entamoeba histolytica HM-3:IMSS]ENY64994.1 nucleosome assembly protein (nap) protein, putative [Entamoeba histolytica HM-1:IMSS-A]GAT96207.1 nucleosome assembly protein putative [Entamoeba histol|eukprot:XP_652700.1 nucleosome assembly protein, putative [Entamoeba histolytica HM-1:IMSS]